MSKRLPQEPGEYLWDEWGKVVTVYKRGQSLFVRVYSHWQPVKISPRIAGNFYPIVDGKPVMEK